MDSFTLLRQQQQDFCHRLDVAKLSLDKDNYLSTELIIVGQDIIEKITLESIHETEDIVHQYKLSYPHKQILNIIFYSRLVEYGFSSLYGQLFSLISSPSQNLNFQSYRITQHHFCLNSNNNIQLLLKSYHGELEHGILTLSEQEFNEHDVFVFCLCPATLNQEMHQFPILFLGFITKELIKESVYYNNNLKFNLQVQDLFYIGGLADFFTMPSEVKKDDFSHINIPLKKGEYHRVISILEQEKGDNLPLDKLFFIKGICYYRLGQKQRAIDCFLKVIKSNRNFSLAYHWLGRVYQDLEDYRRALSYYNAEINVSHLNFFAYFNRAFVHYKLNNFIQALDDYNVAVKINQSFFHTFYNRGFICYKLGDRYGAIDNYLQALKLNPDLASAYYNLAIIYQELSNYKQAIASYKQAIKIKRNYIQAYYNLAILQANMGLYKQSIETYEMILSINDSFIPAIYNHKSLVLLLKKEGHIILSEEDEATHVGDSMVDVIKIRSEDKTPNHLRQSKGKSPAINRDTFNFFAVD